MCDSSSSNDSSTSDSEPWFSSSEEDQCFTTGRHTVYSARDIPIHYDDIVCCGSCDQCHDSDEGHYCSVCEENFCSSCFQNQVHEDECAICGVIACYLGDDAGGPACLCDECSAKQDSGRHCAACQKYDSDLSVEYCTVSGLLHCTDCSVYMKRHELWVGKCHEHEWRESKCHENICDRCGEEVSCLKMPSCATTKEIVLCEWIETEETTDGCHIIIKVEVKDENPLIKKARPNHHTLDRPYAEISTLPRHQTEPEYTQKHYQCPRCDSDVFERTGCAEDEDYGCAKCSFPVFQCPHCQSPMSQTQCPRQYKFYVQTSSSDPSSGKAVYCCSDGKRCIIERYTLFHGENRQECGVECTSGAVKAHENHTGNENSELCNPCIAELHRDLRDAKKKSANFCTSAEKQ